MDLWDLTKVVFRRWYIALPMLLTSVVGVLVLTQSAKPDYSATGYLQMIPPTNSSQVPTRPDFVRNPWTDLGINALAQAAIIKVQDKAVMEDLIRQGYSDSVTLSVDDRSPLLLIEAVGNSPAQATGTVQQLMKLLEEQIRAQQAQYGVATADTITTLVLDDGSNVTVVTTKVKRVIVVALGLGLLLTAAGTIVADAWLNRRARRRLAVSAPPSPLIAPVLRPKAKPLPGVDPFTSSAAVADRPLLSAASTGVNGTSGGDRSVPRAEDSTMVVHVDQPKGAATEDNKETASDTIVLPLSPSRWASRDDEGKSR